ncbi:MAG: DUF1810 domain-containing protein [Oleiphilaceae bacterium]|nr:DUF1810 domain-containing protein [Oleiphilaceae bacterium]
MADLRRFVAAQQPVYSQVLQELGAGRKQSHWMWFVFPQLRGLGQSHIAKHYALNSLDEARDYMQHEVLGPRLVTCTRLVCDSSSATISTIFSYPDDLKFHSSMTLFYLACREYAMAEIADFEQALARYFDGHLDDQTMGLLALKNSLD